MKDLESPLPPLVLRWGTGHEPLPTRAVRSPRGRAPHAVFAGQPWFDTGTREQPLDFTASVRRLIGDIVRRRPEWAHLQPNKILISFTQASSRRLHGLQARVTPLRFASGQLQRQRRGLIYQIQRYVHDHDEFLYLLTFCLPRYLDQDFDHKMVTLFHELHHMSPAFDGDLRRHEGRYHLHSHSKCEYDKLAADLARRYLADNPDPRLSAFLRLNFQQLCERHGNVVGVVVPRPKLIPLIPQPIPSAARHAETRHAERL
jgi:hypothetical protein